MSDTSNESHVTSNEETVENKVYGIFPEKEYRSLKFRVSRANGKHGDKMKIDSKIKLHDECVNAVRLLEDKKASIKAAFNDSTDSLERYNLVKIAKSIDSDLKGLKKAITNLAESVESKKSEVVDSYDW